MSHHCALRVGTAFTKGTTVLSLWLAVALIAGCAPEPQVRIVEVTAAPQVDIVEVTATPLPTDTPPAPITVTVCASGCDYTAIQAAIDDPAVIPGSTIEVADAVHTESEITVNKEIIIQGHGPDSTIVQAHEEAGEATDRVFHIAEGVIVTIRGMTIRHGKPDLEPRIRGVRRCGGGIANLGILTVEDTIVTDNVASGGGGIWNNGSLRFINVTISDNVANGIDQPGFGCGTGGGIKAVGGTVGLINSTISGNRSVGMGGGMQVSCNNTTVLTNSTISSNIGGVGGAVHLKGTLVLVNSTVSDNSDRATQVGGIWLRGDLHATNSIIANNGPQDCLIDDRSRGTVGLGQFVTNDNNWVGSGNCLSRFIGDPRLGPLADNGGDTLTHALLPDSPAIDAVECTLTTDQRGVSRPQGIRCDIGAFEVQVNE